MLVAMIRTRLQPRDTTLPTLTTTMYVIGFGLMLLGFIFWPNAVVGAILFGSASVREAIENLSNAPGDPASVEGLRWQRLLSQPTRWPIVRHRAIRRGDVFQ